jgi:UDP-glucose 4-epimerase
MNQKILITGGAGYIGAHTVHFLIENGIYPNQIIVFDNLVYGNIEQLPKKVNFIKGDLNDKESIVKVFQDFSISSVIHFAAYAYVGESIINPSKYFNNNITGGLNLLEAMRIGNCNHIVFSSSCATYGIPKDEVIIESSIQAPINPYGESKLIFEKLLLWYEKAYDISSLSLRYFNAAGADFGIGEKHIPETHLIPLLINASLNDSETLDVFGSDYPTPDGTCIRDYIHVTDLANAHFLGLQHLQNNEKVSAINLGTGVGVSVKEVINIYEKISGTQVKFEYKDRRPGDPPKLVASNQKAFDILGWQPNYGIEEIIESAWQWHSS